jgi:hypothetical protein
LLEVQPPVLRLVMQLVEGDITITHHQVTLKKVLNPRFELEFCAPHQQEGGQDHYPVESL